MADVTPEPANVYDDRTTEAVKSVLVEIGQTLGSFEGKFAVIGGTVPWLRLNNQNMRHVGSIDVDLGLEAEALGDCEYVSLIEALKVQGYHKQQGSKRFQLVRTVPAHDGGPPIDVVVDFLMPRHVEIVKNDPPILDDFAVQRADGADLAVPYAQPVTIEGTMPGGGINRVEIAVCSIPALLAMKGYAVANRAKQKDAYDIYYCVRNYPGGPEALAAACRPMLDEKSAQEGYACIAEKFTTVEHTGPVWVRQFAEGQGILEDRTPEQWQQDAFGQVDAWLRALGLRS